MFTDVKTNRKWENNNFCQIFILILYDFTIVLYLGIIHFKSVFFNFILNLHLYMLCVYD